MKKKQFDCVEMMHRGARRIYEETKGMSRQEELQYWEQRAIALLPAAHVKASRRHPPKGAAEHPRPCRTVR